MSDAPRNLKEIFAEVIKSLPSREEMAQRINEVVDNLAEPAAPSAGDALKVLSKALQEDDAYAWTWYCNLVMAYIDAGGSRTHAEEAAKRFMSVAYGVKDIKPPTSAHNPFSHSRIQDRAKLVAASAYIAHTDNLTRAIRELHTGLYVDLLSRRDYFRDTILQYMVTDRTPTKGDIEQASFAANHILDKLL